MKLQGVLWKKFAVMIGILLILAYAFVWLMPHSHEGVDFDCVICTMRGTAFEGLLVLVPAVSIVSPLGVGLGLNGEISILCTGREATPVGLKVKLSN